MFKNLYFFQQNNINDNIKKFIKSIDSGIFTGVRDNNGEIIDKFKKHSSKNLFKYNRILKTIKKINNSYFHKKNIKQDINQDIKQDINKDTKQDTNQDIVLYRGINSKLNDTYIDLLPTSFTFNKDKAFDFIFDNGILLEYHFCNINNLNNIIVNINNNEILNEYEVILPPNKYKIIKKINDLNYYSSKYDENLKYNKYVICDL